MGQKQYIALPEGYFQHVPLFADVLKVVAGRVPLIVEYKFDDNSQSFLSILENSYRMYYHSLSAPEKLHTV